MAEAEHATESTRSATFTGEYASLAAISEFVSQAARDADLNAREVYSVQTAVDEACANIIEHAYEGESQGQIECTCRIRAGELLITLIDTGDSFDPTRAPEPDLTSSLEQREVGGLGIYLIRKMMDEINYRSDEEANRLTLIKRKSD